MNRAATPSYYTILMKILSEKRRLKHSSKMSGFIKLPLILLMLSACQERAGNTITPRPLIPITSEAVLNWHFPSPCASTLSANEQKKIQNFLRQNGSRDGDFVIISLPPACEPRLDHLRQSHLTRVIEQATTAGMRFIESGGFGHDSHAKQSGILRLVRVQGLRADCARPPRLSGCAQSQNLAAMTAHPGDHFLATTARRYTTAKE